MAQNLERQAFEARLPKIIAKYLELFKKEKYIDHLPLTTGFHGILREACKRSAVLEPNNQLAIILQNLHPLVCRPVDINVPQTQKNHNELLRTFEVLARAELDTVISFVINRFQLKEKEIRIGSLIILRHLVNSMNELLLDKQPFIMSSVCSMVSEQDITVKKAILQLIVSMSNQNYLVLEGGQTLIKFIVQQAALNVESEEIKTNPNYSEIVALRNAATHTLNVTATKVSSSDKVLWPYLLEFVNDIEYRRALVVLFRCIAHLSESKRTSEAKDYMIDFEVNVNLPSPHVILSRLMILAAEPYRGKQGQDAGIVFCKALKALGPIINTSAATYFDESIPALIEYLESQTSETINLTKWQDTLLKLWKELLGTIEPPKFLHDLTTALGEQFKLFKNDSNQLRIIQRYLGALVAKIEAKVLITSTLDLMLNNVNHKSEIERQGIAQGMGLAGSQHLDIVLPKLTDRLLGKDKPKTEQPKKSGGFFSSFGSSDKEEKGPDELTQSTVILCYGYVCASCSVELVVSRLEVHVTHNLLNTIPKSRSLILRTNLIKTIDLIGKSIHPSRLPDSKKTFKLSQRDELLLGVAAFLNDQPGVQNKASNNNPIKPILNSELRLIGLNALNTLVNLDPPIKPETRAKLCDVIFPYFALDRMVLSSDDEKAKSPTAGTPGANQTTNRNSLADATSGHYESKSETESVSLELIIQNLNTLLSSILHMEPTVASLLSLLSALDTWITSSKVSERDRACETYLILLKKFVQKLVHDKIPQTTQTIPDLGRYLASLVVRCSDGSMSVRQSACETVQALLYVNQLLSNVENPKPRQEIKLISEIKSRLTESNNIDLRVEVLNDLSVLINEVMEFDQLFKLISTLFAGLVDTDNQAAQGTAVMFNKLIELKGVQMGPHVKQLVEAFVLAAKLVRRPEVTLVCESALRRLTKLHFQPIMTQLVENNPVPISKEVLDCFNAVANAELDIELTTQTINYLINLINETPMEKDKPTPIVQTSVQALNHILKSTKPELKALIKSPELYPAVFSTLLMRIGTSQPVGGTSLSDAVTALRSFLDCTGEDEILFCMEEQKTWGSLSSNLYDDGVTGVTKFFCQIANHSTLKAPVLAFLAKFYNQQSYTGQRIVATSMLAEFVIHSGDDSTLLSQLIKFLLPRVADKIEKVRKHAIRGLGNLVSVWSASTINMASSILSSLISAAEDSSAEVAAESVSALTKIVSVIEPDTIEPQLVSICFRLKPSFDRKEDNVRGAAYSLFGGLCRFGKIIGGNGSESYNENFMEQFHTILPIFLVHSNDEVKSVRTSVVNAFQQLAALLEPELRTLISDAFIDNSSSYDEFMHRFAPLLCKYYSDRLRGYLDVITTYFNSKWTVLRGNASSLTAELLHNSTPEARRTINLGAMVAALIKLLDEQNAQVRARTVKALTYLYDV